MLKIFHKRFPGQVEARGFIAPLQRLQKPFVFDQQRGQPARRLYAVTVSEGFGNDLTAPRISVSVVASGSSRTRKPNLLCSTRSQAPWKRQICMSGM